MSQSPEIDDELVSQIIQDTLKPKHATDPAILRFIEHYIVCKHIGQAARLAGLTPRDGQYLFNLPDIYLCITKLIQKAVVKFGFDAEQVVARVREIGEFNMASIINPDGTYKENIHDWPEEAQRNIKKIKMKNYFEDDHNGVPQYKGKIMEVEWNDKMKSLGMMASEKDVMKKTTVVEHNIGKNARNWLLASNKLADDTRASIDVTPQEQLVAPRYESPVVDVKPVPPPRNIQFTKPRIIFKKPGES